MATVKYDVLREHEGDRFYKTGETRDLDEGSAKHLVKLGVLALHDPDRPKKSRGKAVSHPGLLAQFDAEVSAARAKADTAIAEIESQVQAARTDADSQIAAIKQEVTDVRAHADAEISAVKAEIEAAALAADAAGKPPEGEGEQPEEPAEEPPAKKAKATPANKAEPALDNK